MTLHHAHTAYDGTRTYRTRRGVPVAYAAPAEGAATLGEMLPDWAAFGSPTQADGLFLIVAPGYRPEEVPLDPGSEGWLALDRAEIAEFVA